MILISVDDLRTGMTLGVGLHNREGHTLLGPGISLTAAYIARLRELGCWAVWIDDEETRDIPYEHNLSESTRLGGAAEIHRTFTLAARQGPGPSAASAGEIRAAFQGGRLQRTFDSHPAIDRLMTQVDHLVGEVLDRPLLTGLGSLRSWDTYTFHHCLDVAASATMLGRLVGYDIETLKKLAVGCMLHDIGKIFIGDGITNKPGPLTPEESRRIEEHPVLGYLFLRDTLRLGILPAHVAYQHHERQDGTGFPRGLTGTNRIVRGLEIHVPGQILPLAEIAAIADFHDSRSSDRPYRRATAPDQVWNMLREGGGSHFNREMVDLFLSVLPPYPLGSRIVVTGGRWRGYTGVVSRVDRQALARPVIRLLADPREKRVEPFELDLRKQPLPIRGLSPGERRFGLHLDEPPSDRVLDETREVANSELRPDT
jgi:HD-GYP domain-containing protein (c-di-GMP phosphodiesterase class II)